MDQLGRLYYSIKVANTQRTVTMQKSKDEKIQVK